MEWEDYHGMTDKNKQTDVRWSNVGCSGRLYPIPLTPEFEVKCSRMPGHVGDHEGKQQDTEYVWPNGKNSMVGDGWMARRAPSEPSTGPCPEPRCAGQEGHKPPHRATSGETWYNYNIKMDAWVPAPTASDPSSLAASHAHPSGATSSHLAPVFTHLPHAFLQRVAARFLVGDRQHGRGNWHRSWRVDEQRFATWNKGEGSLTRPAWTVDLDFLRDRYNHAVEHLLAMRDEGNSKDDHLGAVAWFLAIAAEFEEATGLDWGELLRVTTPEGEVELRQKLNCPTGKGASAPAPTPVPAPVPPPTPPPAPTPPGNTAPVVRSCRCGALMDLGYRNYLLVWKCCKCGTTMDTLGASPDQLEREP